MSNFTFLKSEWPLLHDAAGKTESLVYPDARSACFYARRALELVVNWAFAQAVFDTVSLNLVDWALATATAASVLLLDEARKFSVVCWRSVGASKVTSRVSTDP